MPGYNFTDRVRKCLQMAREEAIRLGHEKVQPDHILLGILDEGEGVAVAALTNLSIDLDALSETIRGRMGTGTASSPGPDLPYSMHAKRALELAMAEARALRHEYVGTEHMVLGVLRDDEAFAVEELSKAGADVETVRAEMLRLIGQPTEPGGRDAFAVKALALVRRLREEKLEPDQVRPLLIELQALLEQILLD